MASGHRRIGHPALRIHVTGASGAGTTTLGGALAGRLGVDHFDVDDYYWLSSDPPYQKSRDVPERLGLLQTLLTPADSWVLSGALEDWGDPLIPLFDLVIFVQVPTEIRLLRLRSRELQRFGEEAISPGGTMFERYRDFIHWAQSYETADEQRRSRKRHEDWLSGLSCKVLRLSGVPPTDRQLEKILRTISTDGAAFR